MTFPLGQNLRLGFGKLIMIRWRLTFLAIDSRLCSSQTVLVSAKTITKS